MCHFYTTKMHFQTGFLNPPTVCHIPVLRRSSTWCRISQLHVTLDKTVSIKFIILSVNVFPSRMTKIQCLNVSMNNVYQSVDTLVSVMDWALTLAGSCAGVWCESCAAGRAECWTHLTQMTPRLPHRGTAQSLTAHEPTALSRTRPAGLLDEARPCPVIWHSHNSHKAHCSQSSGQNGKKYNFITRQERILDKNKNS